MEYNEVLDRLPRHLMSLVIDQPYDDYTAQDHAVWRYVMRQNVNYLPHVAHSSYLEGLKKTGISIDRIPNMYGMNRILKEIGWAAVAVDGFIPPAAFMEFQAYKVLVIAADIRPVDQIQYTPAPDIIHEAAGHAPIIADPVYAEYLRDFGRLGSYAFSSIYDQEVYQAIRHLSILKADPYSSKEIILTAEAELNRVLQLSNGPSEMALLRNLHWWTVEYGLIGELSRPKIYGAGLLSSIGESYSCLQDDVRKIPYSLEAQFMNFDITTRQPQLYVTPDFEHLQLVLNQFALSMAMHSGGIKGLEKARNSGHIATIVYSSGLKITGKLSSFLEDGGKPAYLKFEGPVMLSSNQVMLQGHGPDYHHEGFGSPVGRVKGIAKPLEVLTKAELTSYGITEGALLHLEFESGVEVRGCLKGINRENGMNLLLSFIECTVLYQDQVLFQPAWGIYDMGLGLDIISCHSGAIDPDAFGFSFPVPEEKTHKIIHAPAARKLHSLYSRIDWMRNNDIQVTELKAIFNEVTEQHPQDWLLPLEICELMEKFPDEQELLQDVLKYLKKKAIEDESLLKLIQDGLSAVKSPVLTGIGG